MGMGLPNFAPQTMALNQQQLAQTDFINNQGIADLQHSTITNIKMQNATAQASLLTSLNMALNKNIKKGGDNVVQLV